MGRSSVRRAVSPPEAAPPEAAKAKATWRARCSPGPPDGSVVVALCVGSGRSMAWISCRSLQHIGDVACETRFVILLASGPTVLCSFLRDVRVVLRRRVASRRVSGLDQGIISDALTHIAIIRWSLGAGDPSRSRCALVFSSLRVHMSALGTGTARTGYG